jgi:hypothetical protein
VLLLYYPLVAPKVHLLFFPQEKFFFSLKREKKCCTRKEIRERKKQLFSFLIQTPMRTVEVSGAERKGGEKMAARIHPLLLLPQWKKRPQ